MLAKPTQLMLFFVLLSLTKLSFGAILPAKQEPIESKIKDSQEPSFDAIQLDTPDSKSQDSETVTQIDYTSLALQIIHKENSSLGLTTTLDLYEFDQIFIIQRHVDSISIEVLQVYLHFTVRATCKPNAGDCADQMRHCRTHFCLNHTAIEDDVCNCEPLPDMFDGAFDAENDLELPSTTEKKSKDHIEPGVQKTRNSKNSIENELKSLLETDNDHTFHDTTASQVVLGNKDAQKSKDNVEPLIIISPNKDDPMVKSLFGGSENPTKVNNDLQPLSSLKESNDEPQKTKENVGPQVVGLEPNDPAEQKELESILGLDDLQAMQDQHHEDEDHHKKHTTEDNKHPTKDNTELEHISPHTINFLNIADDLVVSLNKMNPKNNHNLTLVKLVNVQYHFEAAKPTYTVTIECDYPSHGRVECDVTCTIQPWYRPPQILDYFCRHASSGHHRPTNNRASSKADKPLAKDTAPFNRNAEKNTALSNGNHAVKDPVKKDGKTNNEGAHQNTATPCRDPSQVKLIAEFVMIQMDEIDLDNYRRVLLNVTDVQEELTLDGSGLHYSLSMVMVSTDCLETNSLQDMDDSESCLDSLVNPECPHQYCDVNCVRSLTSDDGPRLVSSECRPVPDSNVGNVHF
uniref:Uncharacterized protein n=1 Tax=Cacopsylla melanoneura TaxID=428564 RepID=A0A8D9F3T8_9HEMI